MSLVLGSGWVSPEKELSVEQLRVMSWHEVMEFFMPEAVAVTAVARAGRVGQGAIEKCGVDPTLQCADVGDVSDVDGWPLFV